MNYYQAMFLIRCNSIFKIKICRHYDETFVILNIGKSQSNFYNFNKYRKIIKD